MKTDPVVWDVVVAGAGIAGAAAALDCKRRLGPGGRVLLCDPGFAGSEAAVPPTSFRALAIAPDMRAYLERLGIWSTVSGDAQPMFGMAIADGRPGLLPHSTFLHFGDDAEARPEPLAHMVLADPLRLALVNACRQADVTCRAERAIGITAEPWIVAVTMASGGHHRTRLVVAADGARSRLRHAARIQTTGWAYPQAAVVATLTHAEDHRGRATQVFLPRGPVALLPLKATDGSRHRVSIVWTTSPDEADRLVALEPDAFCAALQAAVGVALGPMRLDDTPRHHPLAMQVARRMIDDRFALVGDAARVIHPLAGQGLNLGLRDAEALGRLAGEAAALGLDPGSPDPLLAFERERRPATVFMAAGTDALDRLFSTDRPVVRAARDVGLGLVDRWPGLKRAFAAGAGAAPPFAGPRRISRRRRFGEDFDQR